MRSVAVITSPKKILPKIDLSTGKKLIVRPVVAAPNKKIAKAKDQHSDVNPGPKTLVGRLNRKLASQGKVIGKTQGGAATNGDYYLLDSTSPDTVHYLSLSELESLATEFGVRPPIQTKETMASQ
ncbi:MAG: hypothetical protein WB762_13050 [Candidatus Sulfotelmatobacter sp.]